ncbi:MAG: signal recognition particle-docking protein FtsY [Spirochaetia bacterium]
MINIGKALRTLFQLKHHLSLYDEIEDILVSGDLGGNLAMQLRDILESAHVKNYEDALVIIEKEVINYLITIPFNLTQKKPNLILFLGVNGVGKTTSIAKMAHYLKTQKIAKNIVCACGDTFRAAASEQLSIHAQRVGFRVVKSTHGADPAAVIFDSINSAISQKDDLILADTAGRMHNKNELVNELKKIDKVIRSKIEDSCYQRILVIDSTTGQNGFRQAEIFHQAMQISGIIVSKYDSGAKAGAIVSIAKDLKIPIFFMGTGEKMEDFDPFSPKKFLDNLFS